ncbi:MAG: SDH family Clp fold serine proteinase [Gaiellaceae bacterium]
MNIINLLWLFFILASLQPVAQRELLKARRAQSLASLSRRRSATVITLVHRQETMSLLGFPIVRYIDIDDAESILRAIRETPPDRGIEIILHTPGGLVLAATQIASALSDHGGKVSAVIPHYAMSGGTLIALAADEIVMDAHSALGPIDPQLGDYPAASILAAVDWPRGDRQDKTLIMADMARKAIAQVEGFSSRLLARNLGEERAASVAHLLATGTWTHDHPLQASEIAALGLPVTVGVPAEERELLSLYPQPRGRQTAVEYVPGGQPGRWPSRRVESSPPSRE